MTEKRKRITRNLLKLHITWATNSPNMSYTRMNQVIKAIKGHQRALDKEAEIDAL